MTLKALAPLARIFLTLPLLATLAVAEPAQRVDDFVLLDHKGKAQQLHYHKDASAVVLIVQGNGCQIVRSSLADIKSLRDDYAEQGVEMLMINSNLQDDRDSIAREAADWDIDVPILHDGTQIIGRSLNLTRTGEVLVIDPKSWEIVYRGAINNRVEYERQKNTASESYVRDVLDQMLAGETPAFSKNDAPGCLINFPKQPEISYSDTIAPLLQRNCLACHVEGGIAPWAMSEYRMVQGFAPMMREVVRTKRMPPWHADPAVGHWKNAGGMSDEDITTLISWIEQGAPRGDGPDPLKATQPLSTDWTLGEPDLVVEVPAFDVPATGIVDYQFPVIENPLDRDVWVVAATIIPGDTQAVHHVLLGSADEAPDPGSDPEESVFQNYIMGYAPGNESSFMPEGTGVFVPAGGVYLTQMHYTPYGRASTDVTRIGLYFADEPPANFLRQEVVVNPRLKIPPGAEAHEEHAYFTFWQDAVIYSLVPHSHYRGRASTFELVYPDGQTELVLSVPNYDFNWQRTYSFEEPKQVPAGTKIVHRTVYDNSAKNPGNPDPEATVRWGLQSHEEMLYGSVTYSWVDERSDAPIHDRGLAEAYQFMGFADTDMDGVVSKKEMPERLRKRIGWKWWFVDKNKDGGLDADELYAMFNRGAEKKSKQADQQTGGN